MPFNLQTDQASGKWKIREPFYDAPLLDRVKASRPRIDRPGHEASVGPTIQHLQRAFPEIGRRGGPRMYHDIVNSKDDDPNSPLNQIASQLVDEHISQDENLQQTYQQDPDLYRRHAKNVRDELRERVMSDGYTGKDITKSIADRNMDLRWDRKSSDSTVGRELMPTKEFDFLDRDFVKEAVRVAENNNLDPEDLFAVMDFETGGRFTADTTNAAGSGATGLIQFMEETSQDMFGKSTEELAQMSEIEQLEYVDRYIKNRRQEYGQLDNIDDLYMSVFWPDAIGEDEDFVLIDQESRPKAYKQNRGLDKDNKGYITKGDAIRRVRNKRHANQYIAEQVIEEEEEPHVYTGEMDLPVSEFINIVNKYPERYENLVDEDGEFKFAGKENMISEFYSYLRTHDDITERLFRDHVGEFKSLLEREYNVSPIIENDPDTWARAYAVYDRFGKEGVTQFFNFLEEYREGIPFEQQSQKYKKADHFIRNERVDGLSPVDWMNVFTGEEGTPYGKFRVQPTQESPYAQIQFPEAWNEFTSNFYSLDKDRKEFNPLSDHDAVRKLYDVYGDWKPTREEIENFLDPTSEEYEDMVWEIRDKASPQDLMAVLKAHGRYEEIGEEGYRFMFDDPQEQPLNVQLAMDALRTKNEFENVFYRPMQREGDYRSGAYKSIAFEPNRVERLRDGDHAHWFSSSRLQDLIFRTENVPIKDNQGNVVGFEEVPQTGFWNQLWNTGASVALKTGEFYKDYILDPTAFIFENTIRAFSDDYANRFEAIWDNTFGEWDAYDMDTMFSFSEHTAPRLALLGTDILNFYRAFMLYGRMGFATAGKFAKKVNDIAKGRELARVHLASQFGKTGRDYGKWEHLLNRLSKGTIQGDNRLKAAQIALGDVLVQPVTEGDVGFFKHGLFGGEAEEWYKRSNYFTRVFADSLANSIIGFSGDAFISSFPAVRAGIKAKRGEKLSAIYRSAFTPEGDSYFAQYLNFISENAQNLPTGDIASSAANMFRGRAFMLNKENISTKADVVNAVKHDAGDMLDTLYKDVRATVSHYDTKFTGKPRPNLDEEASRVYHDAINQAADQMANILRGQERNIEGFSGIYQLGRLFQQYSGNVREVVATTPNRQGQGRLYTLAQANKVASEGDNRFIQEAHIETPGGAMVERYRVFEAADEDWGFDFGARLKQNALDDDVERAINRSVNTRRAERNLDELPATEYSEISDTVAEVFGAPYVSVRGTGHIAGLVDAAKRRFFVRMDDGRLAKATVPESNMRGHFFNQLRRGDIDEDEYIRLLRKYNIEDNRPQAARDGEAVRQVPEEYSQFSARSLEADNMAIEQENRQRALMSLVNNLDTSSAPKLTRLNHQTSVVHKPLEGLKQRALETGQVYGIDDIPDSFRRQHYNRIKEHVEDYDAMLDARTGPVKENLQRGIDTIKQQIDDDILDTMITRFGIRSPVFDQIARVTGEAFNATKENLTRLFRNLGTDNVFSLFARTPKGKRWVGKNIGEIREYSPLDRAGRRTATGKGTLVTSTGFDGVPRVFYANKKTKLAPSRWITDPSDGKSIIRNPDWDQMDHNVTINRHGQFTEYIKDQETGLYRPVTASERGSGVFLNIQNPIEAAETTPRHLGDETVDRMVTRNNIDAIEHHRDGQIHYRLVDENTQVVDSRRMVNDNIHGADVVELPPQTIVHQQGLKGGVGGLLVGSLSGTMLGGLMEDQDPRELGSWGSAIGLAAGLLAGRRTRAGAQSLATFARERTPFIKSVKNRTKKDPRYFDQDQKKAIEVSEDSWKQRQRPQYGGDVRQPEEVALYDSFMNSVRSQIRAGRDSLSAARNSRFVQSAFTFLGGLSAKARELRGLLYGIEGEPRKLYAQAMRIFESKHGHDGWRVAKQEFTDFADQFLSQRGVRTRDRMLQRLAYGQGNLAYQQWNEAAVRIIIGEARLANNQLRFNGSQVVSDVYSGPNGQIYREFDQEFLRNQKFVDFVDSIREGIFRPVRKRHRDAFANEIDKQLRFASKDVNLDRDHVNALRGFAKQTRSFGQYIKTLSSETDKKLLREATEKSTAGMEIRELVQSRSKFTDLGDAYMTQIHNRSKMQEHSRRWKDGYRRDNPDATSQQVNNAYNEYAFERFKELNEGSARGRNAVKIHNTETGELEDYVSFSRDQVRAKIQGMVDGLDDASRARVDIDDMITNLGRRTDEKGNMREVWGIRQGSTPEEIRAIAEHNDHQLRNLFEEIKGGIVVKNSNFLETPRRWRLPMEWTETDIESLLTRYTRDVTPRLTWIENGVFNERGFHRNFYEPIRRELVQQGVDEDTITRYLGRVSSIFNVQTGILQRVSRMDPNMTNAERLTQVNRMMNFEKMALALRNLAFIPFGYFISTYDTFQPFIHGVALSSAGSMSETTKTFLTNRQALHNLENLGRHMKASMEELQAFQPSFQRDFIDPGFGRTPFDRGLSKADAFLKTGSDLSARLSFSKGIAHVANRATGGMFNIDMENWGLLRLGFDNFYGVNSVSTTMNWYSGLLETKKLAGLYRRFQNAKANAPTPDDMPVRIEGMTEGDVIRKFELVGIGRDRIENFVQRSGELDEFISRMTGRQEFDMSFFDRNESTRALYNDIQDIITHMTDSYHGKSRMFRPETWSSNPGRILSQFKIYPFNFAMQHLQRRIRLPLSDWNQRFAQQLDSRMAFPKVVYNMARNNRKALQEMGLSNQAIDEFPLEAYKAIMRTIYAVNASAAMFITRDAIMDVMEYPFADDEEAFRRIERRGIINPTAPEDQQKTWMEMIDGSGFESPADFFTMLRGYAGYVARSGTFGIYGDMIDTSRQQRDGVTSLFIAGSVVDDLVKSTATTLDADPGNLPETALSEVADLTMRRLPIFGSLGAWRNYAFDTFGAELNKPKNDNVRFIDGDTGVEIDRRILRPSLDL